MDQLWLFLCLGLGVMLGDIPGCDSCLQGPPESQNKAATSEMQVRHGHRLGSDNVPGNGLSGALVCSFTHQSRVGFSPHTNWSLPWVMPMTSFQAPTESQPGKEIFKHPRSPGPAGRSPSTHGPAGDLQAPMESRPCRQTPAHPDLLLQFLSGIMSGPPSKPQVGLGRGGQLGICHPFWQEVLQQVSRLSSTV